MAEFYTTKGIAYHLEDIIKKSTDNLTLVSPFLKLSDMFFSRLKEADTKGVKTVLVYGKDKLHDDVKKQLSQLKNISIFFYPNLHAKCYYSDDHMLISSMNFYEYSEDKNREFGILLNKNEDMSIFQAAVTEVNSIINDPKTKKEYLHPYVAPNKSVVNKAKSTTPTKSAKYNPKKEGKPVAQESSLAKKLFGLLKSKVVDLIEDKGSCIRCSKEIPFDANHPFCKECYKKWAHHKNRDYQEHYCHSCGKKRQVTFNRPLCLPCFKEQG